MRDLHFFRDRGLATGLAVASGPGRTEVAAVADLPEHRLEIHVFSSHALAVAFVEGFELAGGNAVACHREPESVHGKVVVVAFLSEDRDPAAETIEEAVRVVRHAHSGEEGRIISRHLEETTARRERERLASLAVTSPIIEMMRAAGVNATFSSNSHEIRASWGAQDACCLIEPCKGEEGLWRVDVSWQDHNYYLFERELDGRLAAILGEFGLERSDDGHEAAFPPCAPGDLSRLVELARDCWERLQPALLEVWRERSAAAEAERKHRMKEATNQRARERRVART